MEQHFKRLILDRAGYTNVDRTIGGWEAIATSPDERDRLISAATSVDADVTSTFTKKTETSNAYWTVYAMLYSQMEE